MKEIKRAGRMKSNNFGSSVQTFLYQGFWAFTLAEMMVVLLILSIVLAAMAPIMTTRIKRDTAGSGLSGSSSVWQWAENKVDAYFGSEENPTAMIGQREVVAGDPSARLIINTSDTRPNHILFKKGNGVLGRLSLDNGRIILGTSMANVEESGEQSIIIGSNSASYGSGAIVIGNNAGNKNYWDTPSYYKVDKSIAIGDDSHAYEAGVALGSAIAAPSSSGTVAVRKDFEGASTAKYGVAIGAGASSKYESGIAIGAGASSAYGVAIGGYDCTADGCKYTTSSGGVAIGTGASSEGGIAIGIDAISSDICDIAIGWSANNATSTSSTSPLYSSSSGISIGHLSSIGAKGDIAIGDNASAKGYYYRSPRNQIIEGQMSVSIGSRATSEIGAVAIGGENLDHDQLSPKPNPFKFTTAKNYSVAIGNAAAAGESSISIGYNATSRILEGDKSGSANVAIGYEAMTNAHSSRGEVANYNVAIGYQSLYETVTGSNNVAIGYKAMYTNQGNNTTALGYRACENVTGSNKTCIGALSGPEQGDSLNYGDEEVVFIGTRNARVYIPGILTVVGGITNLSDRRLKYVGKEFTSGLDKIRQLKAFNYTFKKDEKKTPRVGVIAQDLQKIFPNAVEKGGDGFLTIRMEDMFYALVNAVKELDAKVTAMVSDFAKQKEQLFSAQKDINALKKENKELKAQNKKLEARLNALEAKIK